MIALVHPECPNPAALAGGNYKHPSNKEALRESTSGKCMYCESKMESVSFGHVEHIKPKLKFPELEFKWENLGFCCHRCNTNKGGKYDETIPFINPYDEDPEEYIGFLTFYAYPKQGSERGKYTINELRLNRPGLVDRRKDKFEKLNVMIKAAFSTSSESLRNQAIAELITEAGKEKEYSAMVKVILLTKDIKTSCA